MINYDLLANFSKNIAVISANGKHYKYKELLEYTQEITKKLESRSLVFCLSQNSIGSLVGYLSFITNNVVPLMLDNSIDQELLDNLIVTYKPEYMWMPAKNTHSIKGSELVINFLDYSLVKLSSIKGFLLHDDIGLLLSTSGSTGSPKLVKLTYKNIYSNAESISEYLSICENERPITSLPMNYSFGLSIINSHLINGATILLTNNSLVEKEFWTFLKSNAATSLSGIPYSFEILKKLRFLKMDLPHLKTLTQAGGKLDDDLNREFSVFCRDNDKRFFVMYGQTEASPRMGYLPYEYSISKLSSMGLAIPGGEFSLIDENCDLITENETIGELVYKGPNVSMGYAKCGDDLAKCDENNGVLVTGDLAKRDIDGFYYIVGRKNRFVKLYGNRISLDETEQLVKNILPDVACSGIDDKMIIYITDKKLIDRVKFFVLNKLKINSRAFEIKTIERIPKTSSGKTIYSDLLANEN